MALKPAQHFMWDGMKALRVTSASVALDHPCIVYGYYADVASSLQDTTGGADATKTKAVNAAAGTTMFGLPGVRFESGVRITAVTGQAVIYYRD